MNLPWPEGTEDTSVLGIDLWASQQVQDQHFIRALCDHRGNLIQGWRTTQPRDETARPENLMKLLRQIRMLPPR